MCWDGYSITVFKTQYMLVESLAENAANNIWDEGFPKKDKGQFGFCELFAKATMCLQGTTLHRYQFYFLHKLKHRAEIDYDEHLIGCKYKDQPNKCPTNRFYRRVIFQTKQLLKLVLSYSAG
jgi:hypothetical protein